MKFPFLWTACVTPFSYYGDSVDYESLNLLLRMQAEAGNGILLLGSTGEGLSLSECEKRELVEFVCKLELNTKIIISVPGVNLYQSLKWLDFCKDMPIHGLLIATPIYTKPGIVGQTLWFERLLNKTSIPAMLYNIPSRAGISLSSKTVLNLSDHENFWAIKDSSGTINSLIEYKKVAPNIDVFCGDDYLIPNTAAHGADGLISVAANSWPIAVHEYIKQCMNGKNSRIIAAWQQACKALFTASNPIPIKALLHDIGLIRYKTVRLPLSIEDLPSIKILRQANRIILSLKDQLTVKN